MDAARQAWASLDDATKYNSGATILFISDVYGENKESIDMEYIGFCDDCNKSYVTYDKEDHCTHCGNCKIHCTDWIK
jgi:hypothetical protein